MCAIHGFCWPDDGGSMERMLRAARHRGPDGRGSWSSPAVTLGHNLLAVSDDPDSSRQPWKHGRYKLVYNGEAYNHLDLRRLLPDTFWTDTDTETVAAGLAHEGPEFLRRVDGMFALAWYDSGEGAITLARDSNGARPLYYSVVGGRLAFSSEVRSLLELGIDRVVSREAFRHYYHAGLVAGPLTMFQGVYKLVPGEVVTYALPGTVRSVFNLNDRRPPAYDGHPDDLPHLIADKLGEAVRLTTSGRRTVGVFLSGGLDSSAVLHEAVKTVAPLTFTTRFAAPGVEHLYNGDADVARDVAKLHGTVHREVLVNESMWVDNFEKAVLALEEPRQGRSHPAYYLTNKAAAAGGVVVALSGDGGDELFAGYKHYKTPPFRTRFEALRAAHRGLKNKSLQLGVDEQVAYLTGWLPGGGLTGDALNDFMYVDRMHTLAEDFLVRSDKMGAAFGMEARFPLLCSVFRDFAAGVPGRLKMPAEGAWDLTNKPLLRSAYSRRLPARVTGKRKTGWRAPTDEWIIGRGSTPARNDSPARALMRELLADKTVRDLFELTPEVIENRFLNNRDHLGPPKASGKPGEGVGRLSQKELFIVAVFAQWLKSFRMRVW